MAAAKLATRQEARRLREVEGWSLARIARELGVAKSSVSVWVRDVPRGGVLPEGALPMPTSRALPLWTSGQVRRCSRCRATLPDVCFNRHRSGRQWWCRACFRRYFRDRGDVHLAQSATALKARRRRARAALIEHLRRHPCADCGEDDMVVLECDHVAGKAHAIAALVAAAAPLAALRDELARCEVVCVNCHRHRTAARAGWRRARADWETHLSQGGSPADRNLLYLFRHLVDHGCQDCRTADLVVLECDHVGTKRGLVTRMAARGCSLDTLAAELVQCEVVCANCHRRRTASRGGHRREHPTDDELDAPASYTSARGSLAQR